MAFPRLSVSMLLASLILLLYWTTSSAQSHDPMSSDLSPPNRVLPFRTREKTAAAQQAAKDSIPVIKDMIATISKHLAKKENVDKWVNVMKHLTKIASWAPGIGGLASSLVNLALALFDQENPLTELRAGFAEMNRKLDSLSIQISNLATDVEWFNYASVYSQDEVRILNAWNKLTELRENSESVQKEEDKLRLAEIFANYYENTGTEASVANLYYYLTVSNTSLSGNLNDLLRKKFKCDIDKIGKYNVYFSSLLYKGMVLNQFYWKLIGFDSLDKQSEHTQMFKDVYAAQQSAMDYCVRKYQKYMEDDVVEISKALSPDDKTAIANQVKNALDDKYFWYNWVVLVYNTNQEEYYVFYDMMKIPVDKITVAVGYTLKAEEIDSMAVTKAANDCLKDKSCDIKDKVSTCSYYFSHTYDTGGSLFLYTFSEYAKATHAAYGNEFAEVPQPFLQHDCWWGSYTRKISVHYSRRLPRCGLNSCMNGGTCNSLVDSNSWLCECPHGYSGDRCEEQMNFGSPPIIDVHVPDISTIDIKMEMLESKLEKKLAEILDTINERCPRQ